MTAVRPGNRLEAAYLARAARRRPGTPDTVLLLQVRALTPSLVGALANPASLVLCWLGWSTGNAMLSAAGLVAAVPGMLAAALMWRESVDWGRGVGPYRRTPV